MKPINLTVKIILLCVCVCLLTFAYLFSHKNAIDEQTTNRIFRKANVQNLSDTNNYRFLKKIGDQSDVIAIGEATHGSKEFNEIRLDFFKYLVIQCNYKLFFIEGDYTSFLPLTDYIENGIGDPKTILNIANTWLWKGTDMLAIVNWMREFNKDKKPEQKVRLLGIDIRGHFQKLFYIKKYFKANQTQNKDSILNIISALYKINKKSEDYDKYMETLNLLIKHDLDNKKDCSLETGDYQIHFLEMLLAEEIQISKLPSIVQLAMLRDKFIASNVIWLCNHGKLKQKGLLAVHNFHVAAKISEALSNWKTCGTYLRSALGNKYFAIYTDFASGSTEAVGGEGGNKSLNTYTIPGSKNAFSYFLKSAQRKKFFLNLREANKETKTSLNRLLVFNSLGSTYEGDSRTLQKYNLNQQFDGYIYLPSITAKEKIKEKLF